MSISEAAVYKQLDSGTPVYSKFYYWYWAIFDKKEKGGGERQILTFVKLGVLKLTKEYQNTQ